MAKQQKTSTFAWEGINRRGQNAKGEIVALNSAYAKAQLRKQGIEPRKVKKVAEPLFGIGGGKLREKDQTVRYNVFYASNGNYGQVRSTTSTSLRYRE